MFSRDVNVVLHFLFMYKLREVFTTFKMNIYIYIVYIVHAAVTLDYYSGGGGGGGGGGGVCCMRKREYHRKDRSIVDRKPRGGGGGGVCCMRKREYHRKDRSIVDRKPEENE